MSDQNKGPEDMSAASKTNKLFISSTEYKVRCYSVDVATWMCGLIIFQWSEFETLK